MGMLLVVCWFHCLFGSAAIVLRRFGDVADRDCGKAPALNVEHLVGVAINIGRDKYYE